jgi:hypothetical protein
VPIGLVQARSMAGIANNHFVVAYGWESDTVADIDRLPICDNRYPDQQVTLTVGPGLTAVQGSHGNDWRGYFLSDYTPHRPEYLPSFAYYWEQIDANPASLGIVADGDRLFQLHNDGRIFEYVTPPMTGWEELDSNPATVALAASASGLYRLHNSGRIFKYVTPPFTGWEELDGNSASRQISAGVTVYQMHADGNIYRYVTPPMTGWEHLDANPASRALAAGGDHLYQLHATGAIFPYVGP